MNFMNIDSQENNILGVRHGTDCSKLTTELDQPLDPEKINEVRELTDEICEFVYQGDYKNYVIYSSPRVRAFQTSFAIARAIEQNNAISGKIVDVPKIVDIDYGEFIIKDYVEGEPYEPLVMAWRALKEACLNNWEEDYYYGQATESYPELSEYFTKLGESHRELYRRIYNFYTDLVKNVSEDEDTLAIVVAHRGTVLMLKWLSELSLNRRDELMSFKPGELSKDFQLKNNIFKLGHAEMIALNLPNANNQAISKIKEEEHYLRQK